MTTYLKKHILQIGLLIVIFGTFFYNKELLGGLIFLIIGCGFLYAGFYIRSSNSRIQANGIKTQAKIIDYFEEESEDADGYSSTYYYPIVRFTDKNGIETTQKLNSSANPKKINQPIEIIYLKKDNEYEIMINSDFWKTYFPIIFIIIGFLFSGIGIIWLINEI
ncbi:DUF3592 domain-containing protein [Mangrovimonas sp. CR14]|uniref:DUF3592 domain-containing protein n=1 Tax=Mangrovimonas sp. CR14 TaxID=2706120 RepID=UPI001424A70A|nr:DUF3592 domain-containing protein [Mangrovimonas sp. CR14]NIK93603.1 DUF3592 domain-containing protein [Mangrovimonas sp. CR14]